MMRCASNLALSSASFSFFWIALKSAPVLVACSCNFLIKSSFALTVSYTFFSCVWWFTAACFSFVDADSTFYFHSLTTFSSVFLYARNTWTSSSPVFRHRYYEQSGSPIKSDLSFCVTTAYVFGNSVGFVFLISSLTKLDIYWYITPTGILCTTLTMFFLKASGVFTFFATATLLWVYSTILI